MEPRHVLLVAACLELGVGVVEIGQCLEAALSIGLVALPAPGRPRRRSPRGCRRTTATTGFSGSTARGSSTNFQVSPILIISGTCRNDTLAGRPCPAGPREDHGVLVEDDVLLDAGSRCRPGSRGERCRRTGSRPSCGSSRSATSAGVSTRLPACLRRGGGPCRSRPWVPLRPSAPRGSPSATRAAPCRRRPGPARAPSKPPRPRAASSRRSCPALIDGDPGPAAVQPAALVEAAVAVQVVLAIDLEAVLVVAPLVEVLPTVGDRRTVGAACPARREARRRPSASGCQHRLDLAGVDRRRVGGRIVIHAGLSRPELEQVLGAVVRRPARGRATAISPKTATAYRRLRMSLSLFNGPDCPGHHRQNAPRLSAPHPPLARLLAPVGSLQNRHDRRRRHSGRNRPDRSHRHSDRPAQVVRGHGLLSPEHSRPRRATRSREVDRELAETSIASSGLKCVRKRSAAQCGLGAIVSSLR